MASSIVNAPNLHPLHPLHQKRNVDNDLLNVIPRIITENDNEMLNTLPEEEEIQKAIFSMSPTSSAGQDGYTGRFYQKCWQIIKREVIEFVQEFFKGSPISRYFTHTCLALIPKVNPPTTFSEVRPISLSVWYSIIINGTRTGFFNSEQGLKQGDPLSPALFIIASEVFSRTLNSLNAVDEFIPFSMNHKGPCINHLAYADDVIIFSSGNSKSIKLIMKIIRRLRGWQGKLLSHGGRMILIKHVLQAIPTHILAAMSPPKGTIKLMEKYFNRFFWGSSSEKTKHHWVSWDNMSYPTDEGGVGSRRMQDVCKTLAMKRWWNFRTGDSLWANFLKAKYCIRGHVV
ncbi:uncharacterized protein LOC132631398 [Lycium barbarum]|uniref:uncharacterized protein LOC132631398 n=1 Tax=Lycium barbarum TaxID=112863 RepID=UPI00293F257F|nr:uncharacterized protein LOC132631398 [Lycium barbarum]